MANGSLFFVMSSRSKGQLLLGLFIFLGLSVLGLSIAASPDNFRRHDRSVSVKGLAERIVPADRAIWPITFTATGNEIESLYASLDRDREIVVQFLRESGFTSGEITASPPQVTDRLADNYGNKPVSVRFTGQQTLSIYTERVDLVRRTMPRMTELGKSGIVLGGVRYGEQPEFLFTGLNAIKPAMIEEATRKRPSGGAQVRPGFRQRTRQDPLSTPGPVRRCQPGQTHATPEEDPRGIHHRVLSGRLSPYCWIWTLSTTC